MTSFTAIINKSVVKSNQTFLNLTTNKTKEYYDKRCEYDNYIYTTNLESNRIENDFIMFESIYLTFGQNILNSFRIERDNWTLSNIMNYLYCIVSPHQNKYGLPSRYYSEDSKFVSVDFSTRHFHNSNGEVVDYIFNVSESNLLYIRRDFIPFFLCVSLFESYFGEESNE